MRLQRERLHLSSTAAGRVRAAALSAALTALCLRGLASPGYVAQLDAVFGPAPGPLVIGFGTPMSLVMHVLHAMLGGAVLGRLCIAGAFFLASFAPMLLLEKRSWFVQLSAGLLGALNPWVYDRIVEGQWGVALAASCLFLWLAAWNAVQERPGGHTAMRLAAISVVIIFVSDAFAGILVVLAAAAAIATRVWKDRERLRWSVIALALWLVLSIGDVVPFFLGRGARTYASVQTFGRADFEAFRSVSDPHVGLLPNLVGLYGYWGEGLSRFPLPKGGTSWWIVTAAVVAGLAVMGALVERSNAWLLPAGIVGIAVSASTATDVGIRIAVAVTSRIPLLAAYREPQKWDALWLVSLVVLSAAAVDWGIRRSAAARRPDEGGVPATLGRLPMALAGILTIAVLVPNGLFIVGELPKRVTPVTYPSSWYAARDFLTVHVGSDEPVAVLPWHLYETLPFAHGRLIANPAQAFFPGNLVVPDDPELPGAMRPTSSMDIGRIDLQQHVDDCGLADSLRAAHIHWALVENSPGSVIDVDVLQRCGYRIAQGEILGITVLNG